jgi:hypothetical protein
LRCSPVSRSLTRGIRKGLRHYHRHLPHTASSTGRRCTRRW